MSDPPRRPHPSSLDLDALALDALAGDDRARVRSHVDACPACAAELAARGAEGEAFGRSVLPRTLPALRARIEAPARWRRWRWSLIPAAVAVAAAVLFALRPLEPPRPPDGRVEQAGPVLAVKGGISFRVFASRGGEVFPVRDGVALAPADRIRFAVSSGAHRHLLIASVDGSGAATVYYPYGGDRSGPIEPGRAVELPSSIVLDDAPGPERVFALFSSEPIEAAAVVARLRAIGAGGEAAIRAAWRLDIEGGEQASVLFEKTTR